MSNLQSNKIDEIDAKGARRVKGMPQVLSISLILGAIVMVAVILAYIF